MTHTELNDKVTNTLTELRSDIETFVKENAKFKIGDVVTGGISEYNKYRLYFVITQIGYDISFRKNKIVYYGRKLNKNSGEVSFMEMDSGVGTPENSLYKTTLIVKNKEISFIENNSSFDIKINFG